MQWHFGPELDSFFVRFAFNLDQKLTKWANCGAQTTKWTNFGEILILQKIQYYSKKILWTVLSILDSSINFGQVFGNLLNFRSNFLVQIVEIRGDYLMKFDI